MLQMAAKRYSRLGNERARHRAALRLQPEHVGDGLVAVACYFALRWLEIDRGDGSVTASPARDQRRLYGLNPLEHGLLLSRPRAAH